MPAVVSSRPRHVKDYWSRHADCPCRRDSRARLVDRSASRAALLPKNKRGAKIVVRLRRKRRHGPVYALDVVFVVVLQAEVVHYERLHHAVAVVRGLCAYRIVNALRLSVLEVVDYDGLAKRVVLATGKYGRERLLDVLGVRVVVQLHNERLA